MSTEMHVLTNPYNGHRLVRYINVPEPFPAYTLRLRFTEGHTPTNHKSTFYNCGRDTVTGAAELAQIPSDWK